jgi:hypothetical protein
MHLLFHTDGVKDEEQEKKVSMDMQGIHID